MPSGDDAIYQRRLVGLKLESTIVDLLRIGAVSCEDATEDGCCPEESGDSGSGSGSGSGNSGESGDSGEGSEIAIIDLPESGSCDPDDLELGIVYRFSYFGDSTGWSGTFGLVTVSGHTYELTLLSYAFASVNAKEIGGGFSETGIIGTPKIWNAVGDLACFQFRSNSGAQTITFKIEDIT